MLISYRDALPQHMQISSFVTCLNHNTARCWRTDRGKGVVTHRSRSIGAQLSWGGPVRFAGDADAAAVLRFRLGATGATTLRLTLAAACAGYTAPGLGAAASVAASAAAGATAGATAGAVVRAVVRAANRGAASCETPARDADGGGADRARGFRLRAGSESLNEVMS